MDMELAVDFIGSLGLAVIGLIAVWAAFPKKADITWLKNEKDELR